MYTYIYDFVSGDSVYWRTELNKVILSLNKFIDMIEKIYNNLGKNE